MPERTSYLPGVPCWVDYLATDPGGAKEFYGNLFGWSFEGADGTGYAFARLSGHMIGGFGQAPPGRSLPARWNTYLATKDIDGTARSVAASGGKVVMGPLPAGDDGRLLVALDPDGAATGFWQGRRAAGIVLADEPGAMCWHERWARDTAAAARFYATACGHPGDAAAAVDGDTVDGDTVDGAMRYRMLEAGGRAWAGLRAVRAAPAQWVTFFMTADPDAALRTATRAGARVRDEEVTSPYGTAVLLQDPWGAPFALAAPPSGPPPGAGQEF